MSWALPCLQADSTQTNNGWNGAKAWLDLDCLGSLCLMGKGWCMTGMRGWGTRYSTLPMNFKHLKLFHLWSSLCVTLVMSPWGYILYSCFCDLLTTKKERQITGMSSMPYIYFNFCWQEQNEGQNTASSPVADCKMVSFALSKQGWHQV